MISAGPLIAQSTIVICQSSGMSFFFVSLANLYYSVYSGYQGSFFSQGCYFYSSFFFLLPTPIMLSPKISLLWPWSPWPPNIPPPNLPKPPPPKPPKPPKPPPKPIPAPPNPPNPPIPPIPPMPPKPPPPNEPISLRSIPPAGLKSFAKLKEFGLLLLAALLLFWGIQSSSLSPKSSSKSSSLSLLIAIKYKRLNVKILK